MSRTRQTSTRRSQEERSGETTRALLAAAARLFEQQGYAATSIEDINRAAGLTRGAIYHHYAGKAQLFRAVFEAGEAELTAAIAAAAQQKKDPWKAFQAGCEAFLQACLDPAVQQIILKDGPAVLGWEVIREIEARYSMAMIRRGVENSMRAGKLARRPAEPLAHLLHGALAECGRAISRAPDPQASFREVRAEFNRLLQALAAE
ncbi:MAG TPA: TetR/AcrR family transcriptional regulator [Nevskia sp.]|nr:TetR/AcrR family transcriptional regulator [Nevskia sp.]